MSSDHKHIALNARRGGYNFIEILVVLSVFTVIMSGIIAALNPSKRFADARNSERTLEVNTIQEALDQYFLAGGTYPMPNVPTTPTCIGTRVGTAASWTQDTDADFNGAGSVFEDTTVVSGSVRLPVSTGWNVVTNTSTTANVGYSLAKDSSNLYLTGSDYTLGFSDAQWRIEKRDLTTGALVSGFGTGGVVTSNPTSGTDISYALAVDSTGLFVAGVDSTGSTQWRIEKRDLTTGALVSGFGTGGVVTSNPSGGADYLYALAISGGSLFAVGLDTAPGNQQWRIEKRDLTTGALVSGFGTGGVVTSNPSSSSENINAVAIDSSGLYVGGFDRASSNRQWRIEKRDLTTGALVSGFGTGGVVTSNPTTSDDEVNALLADPSGLIAVGYSNGMASSQQWRIEKRDLTTGALVSGFGTGGVVTSNPSSGADNAKSVVADSTGFYVGGSETITIGFDSQWRIEKRDLTTGALVSGFGTGGVVTSDPSASYDNITSLVIDSTGIYGGGYSQGGSGGWRVEKFATGTSVSNGAYSSPIQNLGGSTDFVSLFWDPASQPAGTSVKILIATDAESDGPWTYSGPGGTSPASDADVFSGAFTDVYQNCTSSSPCTIHVSHDGAQYVRYRAYLSTSNANQPSLDRVVINYTVGSCYDLSPYLVPKYFSAVPEDPQSTGGQSDTGYTIHRDATNQKILTITAPLAELGLPISQTK